MKIKPLYTLLFIIYSFWVKGQITFENIYTTGGFDYARAITQTFDTGYVTVGSTEGNFGLSDLYMLKVDALGEIMWAKRYGGSKVDWAQDIIETYDSNLLMVGYTNSNIPNSDYNIYLVKTNSNGDSIYTKNIGWNDWDFAYSVQETTDSGYIIAGESYKNGNSQALLIKTNKEGDTLWTNTYGGTQNDKFEKVIITASGDFLMAGVTESFGNQKQAYLVKTTNLGVVIWEKNYGNAQNDFAKSVLELSNGDIIFAGATNTPPETDYDNWMVRIDAFGNYLNSSIVFDYSSWSPTEHNDEYFETVIEINDSLVFGGHRTYKFTDPGNVVFIMADTFANANWQRQFLKYVSEDFESIHDIKKCKDGGMILASSTEGLNPGGASIYLIKIDSNLNFPSGLASSISFKSDISSITDVTQKINKTQFICYPNPINTKTSFKLNNPQEAQIIKIFTITGKEIETLSINNSLTYTHDFSSYKNGIYLASLYIKDRFVQQIKIIVFK